MKNEEKWIRSDGYKYRILNIIEDPKQVKRIAKKCDSFGRRKRIQRLHVEIGTYYVSLMPDDFDPLSDTNLFVMLRHGRVFMCDMESKTAIKPQVGFDT